MCVFDNTQPAVAASMNILSSCSGMIVIPKNKNKITLTVPRAPKCWNESPVCFWVPRTVLQRVLALFIAASMLWGKTTWSKWQGQTVDLGPDPCPCWPFSPASLPGLSRSGPMALVRLPGNWSVGSKVTKKTNKQTKKRHQRPNKND